MLRIKDPKISIPFYTEASSSTRSSLLTIPSQPPFFHDKQIIGMDLIESEQICLFASYYSGSPDTPAQLLTPKTLNRAGF
jgi:hypothetical protein